MLRQIVLFLVQNLVFALLLSVGLRTSVADLKDAFKRRSLIGRTVLVAAVGVPLLAMVLVSILPLTPVARAFILLVSICPGAPLIVRRLQDKMHLSAVVLEAVSLVALVTVPLWAAVMGRLFAQEYQVSVSQVTLVTLRGVLLPMLLGLAIRQFVPRIAAPLAKAATIFYTVALVIALVVVLYRGAPYILEVRPMALLAVVLLTLGAALLGHWAGGPLPEDRNLSATVAALGNPALVAAIAAATYPELKFGAVIAAFVIVRALALLPYVLWMKRRLHGPEQKQPSPPAPRPAHAAT